MRLSLALKDEEIENKHKESRSLKEKIEKLQDENNRLETENRRMQNYLNQEIDKIKIHYNRKMDKWKKNLNDAKNIFFCVVDSVGALKKDMENSIMKLR